MNPQAFFHDLQLAAADAAAVYPVFTPQVLLQIQSRLNHHFGSSDVVAQYGFDPTLHFKIIVSVVPDLQHVKVNLKPLTVLGLDMVTHEPIVQKDESIKQQIRKLQDQQVLHEIIRGAREADQPERGLRVDAGEARGDLEEQGLASEDGSGGVLPVADPGHDGVRGSGPGETEGPDGSHVPGDRPDPGVLRTSEGAKGS